MVLSMPDSNLEYTSHERFLVLTTSLHCTSLLEYHDSLSRNSSSSILPPRHLPLKTYLFRLPDRPANLSSSPNRASVPFRICMANHADRDPIPVNMMHAQHYRFYISIAGLALLQQESSFSFCRLPL